MKYQVINKEGRKALVEYVCFGALQMVDAWYNELKRSVKVYEVDGDLTDWVNNPDEMEQRNGCTYIRGFYPENFQTLQYIIPDGSGLNFLLEHQDEILSHPLFKDVTIDNDDQHIFAQVTMAGKQMDETIYPLLLLRNLCNYAWVMGTIPFCMEHGASPVEALFISNVVSRTLGIGQKPWYSIDGSDSSILHSTMAPLGDLIEAIKGELPRTYLDLKWEETDQGYSSYGTLASPWRDWDDMDWDEDEDDDEDSWDVGPEDKGIPLPNHPITGLPATLVSSSAFRVREDYPEHLSHPIQTIRPTNDEEFVEFIKKVSQYVKD